MATKLYDVVDKICPVCSDIFKTRENAPDEKTTCSHSCANTFFRSGKDHPNYTNGTNPDGYRRTCFEAHGHKCMECDEKLILEVHHIDLNRENNEPENLMPLCPTHHAYIHHDKYKHLLTFEP